MASKTPSPTTWSPAELTDIRAGLEESIRRLEHEIEVVDLSAHDGGPEAVDEIDHATRRIELLQDSVQAENSESILQQTRRVIERLDAGLYGACEGCGADIGRERLAAFPRATSCVPCLS